MKYWADEVCVMTVSAVLMMCSVVIRLSTHASYFVGSACVALFVLLFSLNAID